MKWIEVQIETTTDAEEVVSNIMYDLGVTGLAIEDPNDILEFQESDKEWDFIDPSLIDVDYEKVIVKAYFPESEDLLDKIEFVKEVIERNPHKVLKKKLGKVTFADVYEKDWAEAWKKYYKPTKIGKNIVIKPTWEEYEKTDEEIIIELDPGMAFGTGTHETTMMCIEALESYIQGNPLVYDIGCGSGILSIVAAKLGGEKVLGVDLNDQAVKASNENIKGNKVEDIVEIRKGDLLDVVEGKADIIVSNIIAEVIADMAYSIKEYLVDDGIFICSGIITEKIPMVEESLIKNGFKILEIKTTKEWACIVSTIE